MSLFGGVDLLGEMTKATNEESGPKKVAPPTSKKPRAGSGLFGDIDAGEEDIFAFSGKKRSVSHLLPAHYLGTSPRENYEVGWVTTPTCMPILTV